MPNLTIHNMPEGLHRRLCLYASEHNCTTSEVVIMAIKRELECWDWKKRLTHRPKTDLGIPAADLLTEERSSRTEHLAKCGQTDRMTRRQLWGGRDAGNIFTETP